MFGHLLLRVAGRVDTPTSILSPSVSEGVIMIDSCV